jgi:hypothetical protein
MQLDEKQSTKITKGHGGARPNTGGSRDGAGRKPGVPNKLSGDVKAMILGALEQKGGVEYLVKQADQNPTAFLTLVGKVLPMTVAGDPDKPLQLAGRVEMVIVDPKSNSRGS